MADRVYQGSPEWHEERRTMIGSSDAPRLLGLSKYGTALDVYREKTDPEPVKPDSPEKEEQKGLGIDLEEAIAKVWAKRAGVRIRRKHKIARHPAYSYIGASLDFEVMGEHAVVEVKTRRNPRGWGEPGTATIPDDVWVQVQHQLLATGYGKAYVIAMLAGAPPRAYKIPRDQAFLDDYLQLVIDFWTNHVEKGIAPPWDGSEAGDRMLRKMYPESVGEVIATPEAELLVGQLQDVRRRKAEIEIEEGIIAQRIKDFIGDKERMIGPGFRVRYSWNKPARKTAWKLVAEAYRVMLGRFGVLQEVMEPVVGQYTSESEPTRPFVVEFDSETD